MYPPGFCYAPIGADAYIGPMQDPDGECKNDKTYTPQFSSFTLFCSSVFIGALRRGVRVDVGIDPYRACAYLRAHNVRPYIPRNTIFLQYLARFLGILYSIEQISENRKKELTNAGFIRYNTTCVFPYHPLDSLRSVLRYRLLSIIFQEV